MVVLTTFAIDAPGHGGQLRARTLRRPRRAPAASRWSRLVDLGHQPSPSSSPRASCETVVPRSAEHHLAGEEPSAEARMPVTDIVAGTQIALTPAYLDAVAAAADGASAVILAEPYLLPVLEQLGLDLPSIYDAFNVEADLKAGVFPDTELGRDLLAEVVDVEAPGRAAGRPHHHLLDRRRRTPLAGSLRPPPLDRFTVVPNGTTVPATVADARRAPARRAPAGATATGRPGRWAPSPSTSPCSSGRWHPPNLDAAELLIEVAPQLPDVLFLSVGHHGEAFRHRARPAQPGVHRQVTDAGQGPAAARRPTWPSTRCGSARAPT